MAILTIGRVGLDVEMGHPSEMTESRSIDSREFTLRGFIRSTSLTLTKYLRNELLEQQGQVVAVTYTGDTHFDAFYLLADSRIETMETSYLRRGLFLFEVNLFRVGSSARTEFQSNTTGTVLENTQGLTEGEVKPWLAPPVNSSIFVWSATSVTSYDRVTEDGTIKVYTSAGDYSTDPTWGCLAGFFYGGSAKLLTNSRVRTGLDIPQAPSDWELNNGLIRVRPDSGGSKLDIAVWDGSVAYESEKTWKFQLGGADTSAFSFVSAIRNDPEAVTIRVLCSDTIANHTMDITLRRGSAQVFITWYWQGVANTMKVVRDSTEAATAVTPTGATSTVGVRATANDGGGNRYTLFSAQAITNDTTIGGLSTASANRLNVAIGFEIDGSSAVTGNDADNLALQYFGMVGERVRAVWR